MSDLGQLFLRVVFVLCGLATALGFVALNFRPGRARKILLLAKTAFLAAAGFSVATLILLIFAFLKDDFSMALVFRYSSAELPWTYKLNALWAGSSGLMLLWSVSVFILFALWLAKNKMDGSSFNAASVSIGSAICLVFSAFVLLAAKPFAAVFEVIIQSREPNHLSVNPWMIAHLPFLFVGYAALLIPFVVVMAYVFTAGSQDFEAYRQGPIKEEIIKTELRQLRRWLLFGICFLTLGIAAGARRYYIEFGDFRAWGALEYMSLLPWFVVVAAIHSLGGMRLADKFRGWTIVLGPVPFILGLFVVFIIASGGRKYPPSLDPTGLPSALLIFIGCCSILWLVCIIRAIKSISIVPHQKSIFRLDRIEILSLANIILILTTVVIAIVTLWPLFSRFLPAFSSNFKPTKTFYDLVFSIMGIALAFMLGMCSLADFQRRDRSSKTPILLCSAIGLVCFGIIWKLKEQPVMPSLACGVSAFSFVAVVMRLLFDLRISGSLGRAVSHLGLLILLVAIGWSSDEQSISTRMIEGKTITLAGYNISYDGSFERKVFGDMTKVGPNIVIRKKGMKKEIWPHNIVYQDGRIVPELAVHTGLFEDLYISFDKLMQDNSIMITVKTRPLMFWLWFAGMLFVVGSVLGLLSRGKVEIIHKLVSRPAPDNFF